MTNQSSIKYISGLLDNPAALSEGDQSSIALFRQTFPYFVPTRYLSALESHRKDSFSPSMMSQILPYMGNWMLFCDFLNDGVNEIQEPAPAPRQSATLPENGRDDSANGSVETALPATTQIAAPIVTEPKPAIKEETVANIPQKVSVAEESIPVPEIEEDVTAVSRFTTEVFHEPEIIDRIQDVIVGRGDPGISVDLKPVSIPDPGQDEVVSTSISQEEPKSEPELILSPVRPASFPKLAPSKVFIGNEANVTGPPRLSIVPGKVIIKKDDEIPAKAEPFATPFEVPGEKPAIIEDMPFARGWVPPVAPGPPTQQEVTEIMAEKPEIQADPIEETGHITEGVKESDQRTEYNLESMVFTSAWDDITTPSPELNHENIVPDQEIGLENNDSAEKLEIENEQINPVESPIVEEIVEIKEETEPGILIFPVYTEDYFLHQGVTVSAALPEVISESNQKEKVDKSLMVMMSFSEWLLHFKNTSAKQKEEKKDQKSLKTMWQKEKLAAAMEEENEEIPENVFEMAVNSIAKEDGLASESLADIYIKQGKYDKAIEMYRKLSLRNPKKNAYFARKIEEVLKEKQS